MENKLRRRIGKEGNGEEDKEEEEEEQIKMYTRK